MERDAVAPLVHPDDDVLRYFHEQVMSQMACWLAAVEGVVVGFIAMAPGWIHHLYVLPDYQRCGTGTALLTAAKRADEASRGLSLWTFQANTAARRFYEHHGFVAVEKTDGSRNEEGASDVRYDWPVPLEPAR
ncbi:MAG: GNAT family N-acetyltransferase [Alphaproteobacteria bacterium]|nr:GNAT family N-acetyltransferase [Alphaproteobacteria bacterium]